MNILSVMNYDSPPGTLMCRGWFWLMKRFNPAAKITIFYGDKSIDPLRRFGESLFPDARFVRLDLEGVPRAGSTAGCSYPSQHLTLAGWRAVEGNPHDFNHFLFIEADAWVLSPLDDWWEVSVEKPFIAVTERILGDRKPLLNAGTYSYCSKDHFLSYTKLMEQYRLDGRIRLPVGDQGLVNAYLRRIGYDGTHPSIGGEWNCAAVASETTKADDQEILVRIGPPRDLRPLGLDWMKDWVWWRNKGRKVRILHAFAKKFWVIPWCADLWDYVTGRVSC